MNHQVGGLTRRIREFLHDRQSHRQQVLQRRMLVRKFKEPKRDSISAVSVPVQVPTPLEHGQHAEKLGGRTTQSLCDDPLRKPFGLGRKQLEDVKPFLERRSCVDSFGSSSRVGP
jgi:hypothetical protein